MTDLVLKMIVVLASLLVAIWLFRKARQRLQLSLAKNPSLGGHLRWAKRIARLVPGYTYTEKDWFSIDGAPDDIARGRSLALKNLGEDLRTHYSETVSYTHLTLPTNREV